MRHVPRSVASVFLAASIVLVGASAVPGCGGSEPRRDGDAPPDVASTAVGTQPATAGAPAAATTPETPAPGEPPAVPAPAPPGFGTGVYTDGGFSAPPAGGSDAAPAAPATPAAAARPDAARDTARELRTDAAAISLCRPLVACEAEGATCSSLPCIGAVRTVHQCTCEGGRYTCSSRACSDGGAP